MPIHRLDALTIGQIAAGEIVERPLSVVKELVENAIDAGATRIEVAVDNGGLDAIAVSDDGIGIAPAELPLALSRHATSKLAVAADLESVATLGFRGEGLASVAAVARVEVLSRTADASIGARLEAHGEHVGTVEPSAAPIGTRVSARALFANVPVRREYLRSAAAEFARISTWLVSFALAYPAVTFVLRHDGKDVRVLPASADPRERLAMVFGRDPAAALIPLDARAASTLEGHVSGFVSAPGHDRPDRRMQLLFVNGRLVRSAALAGAWTAGYATYAMLGRYPYGVIFLELPPEHVDPNVHPTKSEVRLRYAGQTFDAVRRTIAATLAEHAAARMRASLGSTGAVSAAPAGIDAGLAHVESLFARHLPDGEAVVADPADVPLPALRVLAQIDRTYVLASDGSALLLVDQHAAHERIAYEAIVAHAQTQAPSEPLLVPVVVDVDAEQQVALERALEVLREAGLEVERFGESAYRIVATPAGYGARPFDLGGFLDDLTSEPKQRDVRERLWASLACHSVTVAGERLEPAEMTTLVERLQQCGNPMHCPHGRPTMVRLGPLELARLFKRA